MKRYLLYFLCFFICVALTPAVYSLMPEGLKPEISEEVSHMSDNPSASEKDKVRVYKTSEDRVAEILLEDYVAKVLFEEFPSHAPAELLKTMAVVVRTFAVYRMKNPDGFHPLSHLCDDPSCCHGIFEGRVTDESIISAVTDTQGRVIYHNGKVINPVYHISSPGKTENAESVFGEKVDYLISVETPDESEMKSFHQQKEFTKTEFADILESNGFTVDRNTGHKSWVSYIARTSGGRVKIAYICGNEIPGNKLVSMFGLQSACVSVIAGDNGFIFTAEGIGHGVGLSIYGGWIMAEEGKTYNEIIVHYFNKAYIAYN